jgi:hypothetical protein
MDSFAKLVNSLGVDVGHLVDTHYLQIKSDTMPDKCGVSLRIIIVSIDYIVCPLLFWSRIILINLLRLNRLVSIKHLCCCIFQRRRSLVVRELVCFGGWSLGEIRHFATELHDVISNVCKARCVYQPLPLNAMDTIQTFESIYLRYIINILSR